MRRLLGGALLSFVTCANFAAGILIVNSNNTKVLQSQQADTAFMPASNTKLFTAAAVYRVFKPTQRFHTTLSEKHHTLYLRFDGDPSLRVTELKQLLRHLPEHQHYQQLVLVPFSVSGPAHALGSVFDDMPYCWSGAVKSATIDANCLTVRINDNHGQPIAQAIGTLKPTHIHDHLFWASTQQLKSCVFQPRVYANNQLTLNGCLPKRTRWTFSFEANNPLALIKGIIQHTLTQRFITLHNGMIIGTKPAHTKRIVQHASPTFQQLLTTMLTDSNNLYAETFTVLLGKKSYGVPSLKAGSSAIMHILGPWAKINFKRAHFEDGAGESRYNLVSPHAIVQLLTAIYHDQTLRPLFLSALAKGGKTGTLAHRFTNLPKGVKVYAKTGSMNGVSTLSGYIVRVNKPTLIFSIMNNGITGSLAPIRAQQEKQLKPYLRT